MNEFLNGKLVEERINNFLGYGNLNGDIWFVGMEEGSSNRFEELKNRFEATKNKEIIDLRDLKNILEHMKWFEGDLPRLQKTWDKLIQIILKLDNLDYNLLNLRKEFQKNNLGSIYSNHCLIELSSLPSTSTNSWVYNQYCPNLDYLVSRNKYLKFILLKRVKLIAEKINLYKPKIVIFYSKSYSQYWNEIIKLVRYKNINFKIIPHPVARGMKKTDWKIIFDEIKSISK